MKNAGLFQSESKLVHFPSRRVFLTELQAYKSVKPAALAGTLFP